MNGRKAKWLRKLALKYNINDRVLKKAWKLYKSDKLSIAPTR